MQRHTDIPKNRTENKQKLNNRKNSTTNKDSLLNVIHGGEECVREKLPGNLEF